MKKLFIIFTFISVSLIASDNFDLKKQTELMLNRVQFLDNLTCAIENPYSQQARFFNKMLLIRTEMASDRVDDSDSQITDVRHILNLTPDDTAIIIDKGHSYYPSMTIPELDITNGIVHICASHTVPFNPGFDVDTIRQYIETIGRIQEDVRVDVAARKLHETVTARQASGSYKEFVSQSRERQLARASERTAALEKFKPKDF